MGIFETEPKDEEEFEADLRAGRGKLWGRYLAMHARRQLSFGETVDCTLPRYRLTRCPVCWLIRYLVDWSCALAGGMFLLLFYLLLWY